jgi:hypothetical protein
MLLGPGLVPGFLFLGLTNENRTNSQRVPPASKAIESRGKRGQPRP